MNSTPIRVIQSGVVIWGALILLAACGASTPRFTVNVTVTGLLSGTSVVLQDNGGDNLTVSANGTAAFQTHLASGSPYDVTVLTQPTGEICRVAGPIGVVASSNLNLTVTCTPNLYTV